MKFERVSIYRYVNLPKRATSGSAGYDFESAVHITIPSGKVALIPTGIKCKIDKGYYLLLALRSSIPMKKGLMLANGVGIIDSDYYGEDGAENEGHIMFQVYNFTDHDVTIEQEERIGQGIFMKYYETEDDQATGDRAGRGFGSTGA